MPLFKKHHDNVDTNYAGDVSDPNYAVASGYPANANTGGTHPSGVGAPIDNSYGNQNAPYGQPGVTSGGTATGPVPGHELGGRTGPGTTLGGQQAPHQANQPTTGYDQTSAGYNHPNANYDQPSSGYDQPTTGYNQSATGYDQNTSGYPGQQGATGTHHRFRDEAGGAAVGAGVGHHMGGRGPTGAATGGFAGRDAGVGTTGATGTTDNMGPKNARTLEMKGKAQQLAGIVLSSQSMKSKGAAKEQEAAAIRHHQTNTAEAEAHEAQARLARERAGAGPGHGTYH